MSSTKSGPNEMRILLQRMRGNKNNNLGINERADKNLSMRDMLKITRKLNEQEEIAPEENKVRVNKKNIYDQTREEDRFNAIFNDMTINVKFIELEVYDDLIFFGGTIDGTIQFIYKVTPDEATSGVEFNYLDNFRPDNPDNQMIINKIESYYDSFYKYWRDILNQDN
jgi:hypothetical protein